MQFKHPELLYALFLLVIPIIVHLFQLRKFKNVPFTNVAFLKNIAIKTRKSSQIKRWLILSLRLMLFTALILAFAQPFFTKNKTINKASQTVIYLDNSFSMQAKGNNGVLLKRAIQDLITNIPKDETVSIITNSSTFKNTKIDAIKNELLQLKYTANTVSTETILLKSKNIFKAENNSNKTMICISDFQSNVNLNQLATDSIFNLHVVKLDPINTNNISVDSAYIANTNPSKIDINIVLSNTGSTIENLPVSLLNNGKLIAKTSTALNNSAEVTFQLPSAMIINGEVQIKDSNLLYDNTLYFNINAPEKIKVLSVSDVKTDFLSRIYTNTEFQFTTYTPKNLNYNILENQNLIILNALERIPTALIDALKTFTLNGGSILVIPAVNTAIKNYNNLLANYGILYKALINSEKRVTNINYSHPLYNNGVFEKRVTNFQYPKVNSFFTLDSKESLILSYEDNNAFLIGNTSIYVLTAALENGNSNFKNSPLIVPTFYNIAKNSFKIPQLYYTVGTTNSFDVKTSVQKDGILSLKKDKNNIIPKQQNFLNKVVITTDETPEEAGIYSILNKGDVLKHVSYNYNRNESKLSYQNIANNNTISISDSVEDLFIALKSDTKSNSLWIWFIIFALILLFVEMLILKFFK